MYQTIVQEVQNNQIAPVYLLWGPNRYFIDRTITLLREAVAEGGSDAFNVEVLDALACTPGEVAETAGTLPFLAARKIVIVRNVEWFAAKADKQKTNDKAVDNTEAIYRYLLAPAPSTVLVLDAGEKVVKSGRLFKAAAQNGEIAEFLPFRGEAALLWAQNLFSSQGKSIGRAALQQLLLASGDNLSILEQEAAKLCLYVGRRKEITLADVQLMASDNSVTSVFTLLDHIVAGHTRQALAALEQVLIYNDEYQLLPLLAGHFHLLLLAPEMRADGHDIKEIMKVCGKSHPFIVEKALRQAKAFYPVQLEKILSVLLLADWKIKDGSRVPRAAIEAAIIQICAIAGGDN